jgi:hypothetical protein
VYRAVTEVARAASEERRPTGTCDQGEEIRCPSTLRPTLSRVAIGCRWRQLMERSGGTIEHAIHAIHAIHAAVVAAVVVVVAIRDIVGNVVQVGVWRRRAQPGLQGAAQ